MKLPKSTLFVTGTDTSVGKTYISALLLDYMLKKGLNAGYQKWVSTGDTDIAADYQFCLKATGLKASQSQINLQVPYTFKLAASPHLAAEKEGASIDPSLIKEKTKELGLIYEIVIIEGAGGLLVPLRRDYLIADLLSELKLPTLIIARSGLGTLNHTFLTLEALRSRKIPILGVIFSDATTNENEMLVADNMKTIAETGKTAVFGRVKRHDNIEEAKDIFQPIGDLILTKIKES